MVCRTGKDWRNCDNEKVSSKNAGSNTYQICTFMHTLCLNIKPNIPRLSVCLFVCLSVCLFVYMYAIFTRDKSLLQSNFVPNERGTSQKSSKYYPREGPLPTKTNVSHEVLGTET